jgi:two-component system response regulator FixJ
MAVEAMKAGVSDFIVKPFQSETVTAAVRRALDYDESRSAKEAYRAEVKRRLAALTPREREVLVHLSDGLSNKEIGIALNISWRTVESYRARVMQKMQAQSLSELLRMQLSLAARED